MRRKVLWSLPALPLVVVGVLVRGVDASAVALVYLAAVTPWLVAIDVREHRLPNPLVLPGILAGLAGCGWEWIATGRPPLVPLIAGVAYPALLLLLCAIGGMGMGDVKLAAALGLASWNAGIAVLSPAIAFLVGGVVAAVLLIAGHRGSRIAFGPYLLGGFWAAVVVQALVRF